MIVRFTPRAEADLEGILDYLERRSPNGARRVAASLLQTIEVVASHPQSGASTRRPGRLFLDKIRIVRYTYSYKQNLPPGRRDGNLPVFERALTTARRASWKAGNFFYFFRP
jgi:plasmid stabilization system protein ParE